MMSASNKMISDFMAIAERTAVVAQMWPKTGHRQQSRPGRLIKNMS
ncbi:hypothetical protein H2C43_14160 [Corynebacterium glutamicum]|nr:hypothetical protein [Corynebacterium glutamicum]MBA4570725.1 hypothetical protein [Corynebacterium glutamicum]MBA4574592.1 hypothetical protein [Corynebacterium glutamicum]MBA4577566.1 hypothetical protein [Corynebacterium glutamicum]MBA4580461.1 hypothetical protein [Corynebacterium glutamicum]MBA4583338.1 hypothetical protein [Corynebacterium glutamicum]